MILVNGKKENIAIECGDTRLSYAILEKKSDELANDLMVRGATGNSVVVVCLVAMIAPWRAIPVAWAKDLPLRQWVWPLPPIR